VTLAAVSAGRVERSFAALDGVSYSHRGQLDRDSAQQLREVIDLVHPETRALVPAAGGPDAAR
jgi:hypothetical protein